MYLHAILTVKYNSYPHISERCEYNHKTVTATSYLYIHEYINACIIFNYDFLTLLKIKLHFEIMSIYTPEKLTRSLSDMRDFLFLLSYFTIC